MGSNIIFRKSDVIIALILGEIVGLFAYAIIRVQGHALPLVGANPSPFLFIIAVPIVALVLLYVAYFLDKKVFHGIFQFGKFAAVGFSNTAIDWGILNLLLIPFGLATGFYAINKAITFGLATLNSFLWNRFWSFEKRGSGRMGREAVLFYLFTAGGLAINVGVATTVKVLGPDTKLWAGLVAPFFATAVSMFWDFFTYRFIVFKHRPVADVSQ